MTNADLSKDDDNSVPEQVSILVQVHLAEYQALTTRATYFITLMGTVWPVLLIFLGLLIQGQLWTFVPVAILLWGSGILIQISLLVWAQLLFEQYSIVRYTETELRQMMQSLVGNVPIWQYEPFLARQRGNASVWWEYSTFVGLLVAIGVSASLRWPLSKWDIWGAGANLVLLVIHALRTVDVVRTRRGWEKSESGLVGIR